MSDEDKLSVEKVEADLASLKNLSGETMLDAIREIHTECKMHMSSGSVPAVKIFLAKALCLDEGRGDTVTMAVMAALAYVVVRFNELEGKPQT